MRRKEAETRSDEVGSMLGVRVTVGPHVPQIYMRHSSSSANRIPGKRHSCTYSLGQGKSHRKAKQRRSGLGNFIGFVPINMQQSPSAQSYRTLPRNPLFQTKLSINPSKSRTVPTLIASALENPCPKAVFRRIRSKQVHLTDHGAFSEAPRPSSPHARP